MPNWATNTLRFEAEPEMLTKLKSAITEDGTFDFNVFMPCPPELKATVAPVKVVATQEEADELNAAPNPLKDLMGDEAIRVITEDEASRRLKLYGHLEWYGWQNANWGTKWEGGDALVLKSDDNSLTVYFQTAWDRPRGLLDHLEAEGVKISGGTIHEDGDEFELYGDITDFDRYFTLEEISHTEDEDEDDAYVWVERHIRVKEM